MAFHGCTKWLLSLIIKLIIYFCYDIFPQLSDNI